MFEWFFKYPRVVYQQGELVFAGDLRLAWWLAAALLLALSVVFARRLAAWPWHRRVAIHALQFAALAVLLTILAGPALQVLRLAPGVNTVAVLVDTSRSMALPDARGRTTRLERAKGLVAEGVGGQPKTVLYQFDDQLRPAEMATLEPTGDRSRLVHALSHLAANYDHGALAAIVLLTDGAQTPGDVDGLDVLTAAGVPVHAVGLGAPTIVGDAELAEVSVPRRPPPGTEVTARVTIRHAWSDAGEVRLRVRDGESVLAANVVALAPQTPVVVADVSFPSGAAGLKEVTFELLTPEGDPLPSNDSRTRLLEVVEAEHRVLYLEGEPRWEYKFIRRAVEEDPAIKLVTWLRTTPRKTYRQGVSDADELVDGFPASLEALYAYGLVILGSLPASTFDDEQHALLESFVAERGGSVLVLAGREALAEGGWDVKPLSRALPVVLERAPVGAPPGYTAGEYAAHPTPAGLSSPLADIGGSSELDREERWATLPMLGDYQRLGPLKAGATTLLEGQGSVRVVPGAEPTVIVRGGAAVPLLVAQPYGFGQAVVLATASTWRWRMRTAPGDDRHGLFWRHLIRHLAGAAPATRRLSVEPGFDALDLKVSLKDARFKPIADASVTARITAPTGENFNTVLPPAAGGGAFGATVATSIAGVYRVDVTARAGGEGGAGTTFSRLARVGGEDVEAFSAAMNTPLLSRIAAATGGRLWTADDLAGLEQAIAFGGSGIRERERMPLWDAPILYIVLVLLKCIEWSLRRFWGGI